MKAAVFSRPGAPLTIQEVDIPDISADEMLVAVSRCGICGTDIHASREGPFMAPPNTIFGHEFSGEIVKVGDNINRFSVGDRVTSLPFIGDKTIGLGQITGAYSEYVRSAMNWLSNCRIQLTMTRAPWWNRWQWVFTP